MWSVTRAGELGRSVGSGALSYLGNLRNSMAYAHPALRATGGVGPLTAAGCVCLVTKQAQDLNGHVACGEFSSMCHLCQLLMSDIVGMLAFKDLKLKAVGSQATAVICSKWILSVCLLPVKVRTCGSCMMS